MSRLFTFFSAKNISICAILNDQSFNDTLTDDIVSFKHLGPEQQSEKEARADNSEDELNPICLSRLKLIYSKRKEIAPLVIKVVSLVKNITKTRLFNYIDNFTTKD